MSTQSTKKSMRLAERNPDRSTRFVLRPEILLPSPNLTCTQIKTFNKDNVSNSLMTKVKKYVNNPDFSFENVAKVIHGEKRVFMFVV